MLLVKIKQAPEQDERNRQASLEHPFMIYEITPVALHDNIFKHRVHQRRRQKWPQAVKLRNHFISYFLDNFFKMFFVIFSNLFGFKFPFEICHFFMPHLSDHDFAGFKFGPGKFDVFLSSIFR